MWTFHTGRKYRSDWHQARKQEAKVTNHCNQKYKKVWNSRHRTDAREGREKWLPKVPREVSRRESWRPLPPYRRALAKSSSGNSRDAMEIAESEREEARTGVPMDQEIVQEVSARMQAQTNLGEEGVSSQTKKMKVLTSRWSTP